MFVQSSGHWNHHHTNSSQDPGIAATEAVKPVSNMRLHPRASLKDARGTDKDVDKKAWLGMWGCVCWVGVIMVLC